MYIRVHVTPGSKKEQVTKSSDTEFHMRVREEAQQNMANKRVIVLLSQIFNVATSQIHLLTGHRSSTKMFSIDV